MKNALIIALLLVVTGSASAQISPFTFGPVAGFTQTQLISDKAGYTQNAKAGLQGGLFARIQLAKFIIQPEAYIGLKRGDINFSVDPAVGNTKVEGTQELSLTTLDVPLMFGWELLDAKIIKLRAMAGPVAGVVLNQKVSISTTQGVETDIPETDKVKLKEDAIWSAQAGIGIDVLKFTLDVRYQLGISDISLNQDLSNNLWHFAFGFKFL